MQSVGGKLLKQASKKIKEAEGLTSWNGIDMNDEEEDQNAILDARFQSSAICGLGGSPGIEIKDSYGEVESVFTSYDEVSELPPSFSGSWC